jgi:hypothetical protein
LLFLGVLLVAGVLGPSGATFPGIDVIFALPIYTAFKTWFLGPKQSQMALPSQVFMGSIGVM